MRDVIFAIIMLSLVPICYRRPFIGLLTFSWLAYMRTQDLCWGFAREQRWSFLIAIVTMLGYSALRPELWFRRNFRCYLMMTLVVLVTIGILIANMWTATQVDRWVEFTKIIAVALFTTAVVQTAAQLRVILWVIALSLGFYGVKDGLVGVLSGMRAEILVGPGGMLADNNDFALAMVMSLPMLFLIGRSEANKTLRRGVLYFITPLTVLTVMMTHSRGGFLAMAAAFSVLVWRSRNRVAGFSIGALVILCALLVAPKSYIERVESIQNYEADGSAMGRLAAWRTAINMAEANPVFGVGLTLFMRNYATYKSGEKNEGVRVAHNSYLQIWAECGTLALGTYLLMMVLTLVGLWRIQRKARQRYFTSWITNYAVMFEATWVAFIVGSTFLNRAHFDLAYHWIALVIAFEYIADREMEDTTAYPRRMGPGLGELRPVEERGFAKRFGRMGPGRPAIQGGA
ncbi:MAG TPA: putative O-glycosylation ligase, exosortase A system-associated [Planctomycetota bacterium]|nr:putative O-glycosylation ligase, exosortase A system-associated [Planctomycetota bacterium]